MFRAGEIEIAKLLQSSVHRVERIALARENAEFDQLMKILRQLVVRARLQVIELSVREKLSDFHLIHRQRPGLVHAQDRRRPQRLYRRRATRQHLLP